MDHSTNNVFAEISRSDDGVKTCLAIECAIRELVKRGYLITKVSVTPRGVAIYDQLCAGIHARPRIRPELYPVSLRRRLEIACKNGV